MGITEEKSLRIAKFAFEYAKVYNRKKVTAIHKANIMKLGDGLFLECCREVSKQYPDIEFNDLIIDNASMQMGPRYAVFESGTRNSGRTLVGKNIANPTGLV